MSDNNKQENKTEVLNEGEKKTGLSTSFRSPTLGK